MYEGMDKEKCWYCVKMNTSLPWEDSPYLTNTVNLRKSLEGQAIIFIIWNPIQANITHLAWALVGILFQQSESSY